MGKVENRLRRVVTGINGEGRSVVLLDNGPAAVFEKGGIGLYEIWNDNGRPIQRSDVIDIAKGDVVLAPPPNGARVRWFSIAPPDQAASAEAKLASLEEAFNEMGGSSSRVDLERHPGMHLTKTMDIIMVWSGQIRLILEEDEVLLNPGDVVVQRGTNHAWEAVGDQTAWCLAVLLDRELA